MEMIHSRSYTYIIKNVYSDPSEVFDKIVTDDRILEHFPVLQSRMMISSTVLSKHGVAVICGRPIGKIHLP